MDSHLGAIKRIHWNCDRIIPLGTRSSYLSLLFKNLIGRHKWRQFNWFYCLLSGQVPRSMTLFNQYQQSYLTSVHHHVTSSKNTTQSILVSCFAWSKISGNLGCRWQKALHNVNITQKEKCRTRASFVKDVILSYVSWRNIVAIQSF